MAVARKNNYVTAELDWAETQLENWKAYVENNPVNMLKDRVVWKEVKGCQVPQVVASIEAQGKFIQETMKNYLALLEIVDKLREKEEAKKVETRSGFELTGQAEEFLKSRER